MTRAVISIGTNSTRLLIVDENDHVLAVDSRGTRLGSGLARRGRLDPAARERTLGAIDEYVRLVRAYDARLALIATSAMRRASDGDDFSADLFERTGARPRILSGDEEATYSFLGATRAVAADEVVGVLDVGGGSSELGVDLPARARASERVAFTLSIEIGAVRLSERYPALLGSAALAAAGRSTLIGATRADIAATLQPYDAAPRPDRLIAVGGTAFTAAAMIAAAPLRDGVAMTHADRIALIDALLARALDERKAMAFIRPQRADILPAGLLIIDEACTRLAIDTIAVSIDDLLLGYLRSDEYAATATSVSTSWHSRPG